ncbi:MAG TPA: hypothetical protein VM938_06740 [Acidimicrobiales bacterium]|nr:hypothetical protein [Acidimicrobiales bacterium]
MRRSTIVAGALAVGFSLGMPVAAVAQDYVNTTDPPRVRGTTETRTGSDTKVAGVTTSRDAGSLAVTGGDIVGMVAIGAGAIGLGTVLVRRGRTRSTASA